jgi:hypothetical protein
MLACAAAPASAAAAKRYAPLNQPGPPLSVPPGELTASLYCEASVRDAHVEPVLLSPGTGATPAENYSWNWEPALTKLRIPWCAYTAPHRTLGDIATSGEYLVYAIRTMYALAHRPIAIIGHSQGGMSMRWALRFWPDTREMVEDVIGLAATNHGTTVVPSSVCSPGCTPAVWQQLEPNAFIPALNSYAETFAGISYTNIYTHYDQVAKPDAGPNMCTSCLHTGRGQITNVAVQDICPRDGSDHVAVGTWDPAAYALAVDALRRSGPAQPARISKSVCFEPYMPGVNPVNLLANLTGLTGLVDILTVPLEPAGSATSGAPYLRSEPPLACYVFAACRGAAAPTLRLSYSWRRQSIRVLVRTFEGGRLVPVPDVTVTLDGRRARTNARGIATLPRRHGRLVARRAGCNAAVRRI